jgi:type VI protein secretion system component VasK
MNNRTDYDSWLKKRRSVELSSDFAHAVMKQVALHERERRTANPELEMFRRWLERMAHHPLVKLALLVVALVAGIARFLATWQIVLSF